jgi:hypothetical protein
MAIRFVVLMIPPSRGLSFVRGLAGRPTAVTGPVGAWEYKRASMREW